jgi:hypothetical protein
MNNEGLEFNSVLNLIFFQGMLFKKYLTFYVNTYIFTASNQMNCNPCRRTKEMCMYKTKGWPIVRFVNFDTIKKTVNYIRLIIGSSDHYKVLYIVFLYRTIRICFQTSLTNFVNKSHFSIKEIVKCFQICLRIASAY